MNTHFVLHVQKKFGMTSWRGSSGKRSLHRTGKHASFSDARNDMNNSMVGGLCIFLQWMAHNYG